VIVGDVISDRLDQARSSGCETVARRLEAGKFLSNGHCITRFCRQSGLKVCGTRLAGVPALPARLKADAIDFSSLGMCEIWSASVALPFNEQPCCVTNVAEPGSTCRYGAGVIRSIG